MNYSAKNLIRLMEKKGFYFNVPMVATIYITMLQPAKQ